MAQVGRDRRNPTTIKSWYTYTTTNTISVHGWPISKTSYPRQKVVTLNKTLTEFNPGSSPQTLFLRPHSLNNSLRESSLVLPPLPSLPSCRLLIWVVSTPQPTTGRSRTKVRRDLYLPWWLQQGGTPFPRTVVDTRWGPVRSVLVARKSRYRWHSTNHQLRDSSTSDREISRGSSPSL